MTRLFAWAALAASALAGSGADYAQAGALARAAVWEIGVVYDSSVNSRSAASEGHYLLPEGAQLEDLRHQPLNNSVILTVTGLASGSNYTLTVTNIPGTGGAVLPAAALPFATRAFAWAPVGGQELAGAAPDAIALGEGGFDLISGGVEMWGAYDESSFAYETVTGNFDKRVRVVSQEGSSEEARAGLMVREVLDENKPRATNPENPEERFSRYLQVQVNPVSTAFTDFEGNAVPGRNQHQVNARFTPGGPTENPAISDNAAPPYPNAWLRIRRSGQTFHLFRGSDGTNWVRLGSFTFPAADLEGRPLPPFAGTVFVGPNYSPETDNIPVDSGARRAFLARFRDYSNAEGEVNLDPPGLAITRAGSQVELSWTSGTLEGTPSLTGGAWTVLGTSSPLRMTPDRRYQFFRARNP